MINKGECLKSKTARNFVVEKYQLCEKEKCQKTVLYSML